MYLFYSNCHLHGNSIVAFRNKNIENLRKSLIAAEIYQALKRINRDNIQSSIMNMFIDDEHIFNIISAQFQKINIEKKEILLDNTINSKKSNNKTQISLKEKLLIFLKTRMSDNTTEISKKEVCKELGVKHNPYLSKLLKKTSVKEYIDYYGIQTKGQKIIFPQK